MLLEGCVLTLTLLEHPLWRVVRNLEIFALDGRSTWLLMAAFDAFGARLCFCGIVASSERPCQAVVWIALCLIGGTPALCAYLLVQLMRSGTLESLALRRTRLR